MFESKKLLTVLYLTFPNILQNAVSNEIDPQLDMQDCLPLVCRDLAFKYLKHSGKISVAFDGLQR
jgi:hypothetical protein